MMTMNVLITGVTKGIGCAIAKKYKQEGMNVIGTGTIDTVLDYVNEYIICDFSNIVQLEVLCETIKNLDVNILINNAGINIIDNFCEIKSTDFIKVQQVNLYAPFRLSQSVIPNMRKNKWGRIVNISSVWGIISKKGRASYSASKFGIDGLTVSMSNEFAKENILCNCIAPGFIDTDMTWNNLGEQGVNKILEFVPINRLATVDEIANLVYMLGSQNNTYITGQNIAIDGGFTRA